MNPTENQYAAYVGIDWADRAHAVCVRAAGADQDEQSVLPHTPEALHEWARQLQQRFGHASIAIAVEQSRGPLIYALLQYPDFELFPVNPAISAKYREAATAASGRKDDPLDAGLICELLRVHRDWLRPLRPMPATVRQLQLLLEARRGFVDQRTALVEQLTAALKAYYPQALQLVGNLNSPLAWAFLRRWPTLAALQAARPTMLERFYRTHGLHAGDLIAARLQRVRSAVALTADAAVLSALPLQVHVVVAQIEVLYPAIADYDQRIARLFAAEADAPLFASLPGAGPQLAPRLYVAFGPDRSRFQSAAQLQCFSGIAPVTTRSGHQHLTQWRWHCPTFLRQTFQEFAGCSVPHSRWARAFYQQQLDRGKTSNQAKRALAYKWQRIVFHCWVTHTPYDEARYLAALRQHQSPLVARIDAMQEIAA
jgi:transposase